MLQLYVPPVCTHSPPSPRLRVSGRQPVHFRAPRDTLSPIGSSAPSPPAPCSPPPHPACSTAVSLPPSYPHCKRFSMNRYAIFFSRILDPRLSFLDSRFSILHSQFPILDSRFSTLDSPQTSPSASPSPPPPCTGWHPMPPQAGYRSASDNLPAALPRVYRCGRAAGPKFSSDISSASMVRTYMA
jgi:hypothetical protein